MSKDTFGNLKEWGEVLDQLEELKRSRKLQECQKGLVRILRFKNNWRLRESVLESIKDLEEPGDALIEEVVNILADSNVYYEARLLAADALGSLLSAKSNGGGQNRLANGQEIGDRLNALANTPHPAPLQEAISRSIEAIRA